MSKYKTELDSMVWSYSRVHSYCSCPYQFYLKYIEVREYGISNFYAENGSAVHDTMEELFKNTTDIKDCIYSYLDKYDLICNYEKDSIMENTMMKCCDYFSELDLSELNNYEILGVEKEVKTKIGRRMFQGRVDLLLRRKTDGAIIIEDHKSRNYPMKKDGITPLKSSESDFKFFKYQLYLYCKPVFEEYGEYPSILCWNHFKDKKVVKIPFIKDEYEDSIKWFKSTINKIYRDNAFKSVDNYMMCNVLCPYREGDCEYKKLRNEQ